MAEVNPYPDINWADEPTVNVINGANAGIELAIEELNKRNAQIAYEIAILSNKAQPIGE